MKLRADFHTHTTYCDGKSTPRQMVEAAYRMGLTDFGISGHADFSMYEPGLGMTDEILEAYKKELRKLKEEYAGKMNLYIGIELDTLVEEAWKVDGVIGSRMTGAGFGGCTVSIVKDEAIEAFQEQVGKAYLEKIGYAADFYVVEIGDGPVVL